MKKQRAFLKWAGGKYGLVEDIQRYLPPAKKLIEPFVGAGSVFLNTDYEEYLLADINQDLINIYNLLKTDPEKYIQESKRLFKPESNHKAFYLDIRAQFNASKDVWFRSIAFLYMNRHCFNGLCRYNRSGGFNVPFGSYKRPYFPEQELISFAEKAHKATFVCAGYPSIFSRARRGNAIYCDPPYAPLSNTANFTAYVGDGFTLDDQATLADLSERAAKNRGISVLISNHDTAHTRRLYKGAQLKTIQVKRTISGNGAGRNKVDELFALFAPQQEMGSEEKGLSDDDRVKMSLV